MKVRELIQQLIVEDMDDEILIATADKNSVSVDGILSPSNARSHVGVVYLAPDCAVVIKEGH